MDRRHILIVYATGYGQAAKIAVRMADLLAASGAVVRLVDARAVPPGLTLGDYDGIIIGGSIHYGRHQRCLAHFVIANRKTLNTMQSAFFSVSGAAASPDAAQQAEARRYIEDFLRRTGWHPGLTESLAGAMAYTKYNPLLRRVTKRAAREKGGPTDTSRDHEFTDWTQVEAFVDAFVAAGSRIDMAPTAATV